jgi:diguanylate cyclase (GGDEF)-like protein
MSLHPRPPGTSAGKEVRLPADQLGRNTSIDSALAAAIIDALTSHICVVDSKGIIFAVNRAWRAFAADNSDGYPVSLIGADYLKVCRNSVGPASEEATTFADGLTAVLQQEREFFQIEYPCHSPKELRWFLVRVSPLRDRSFTINGGNVGAVVSHMNVTDRKLVELEHAKLASTDPLTGIPNRRFFESFVKLDIERSHRFGEPSSLLMVDLDNFKSINDTFGHAAGDEVIRRVASLGKTVFRSCDLLARLGGEEFVALLSRTDESGAIMAAEKLRAAIEKLAVVSGSKPIVVTASIGVSSIMDGDPTVEHALLRADKALYLAKRNGRNCVKSFAAKPSEDGTST